MTREPAGADDPAGAARERAGDRARVVEALLEAVDPALEEHAYPANSDELVAHYRTAMTDLPNETESPADALDRIADEYDEFADPAAARAALTTELRRDERFDEVFTDDPSKTGDGAAPDRE